MVIGYRKGGLRGLGCARFRIKHWRGTAIVENGFSDTPEHEPNSHTGTNQHGIPGKVAKFRLGIRTANPNIAVSTKCQ